MSSLLNDKKIKVPVMRDMSQALNKMLELGYKENFKATDTGLLSLDTQKHYTPDQLVIANFFRFEGISDPDDNSILYVIEASDGAKGTIMDAYGAYSDALIEKIMKQVKHADTE
jgi:hypothetical protein